MPAVGFICPIERAEVDFDHFDTCIARRGQPAINPATARFMARAAQLDVRHAGMELTVTRCLTCPRQTAIETSLPYYIDPSKQEALTRGTMLHTVVANEYNPEVFYTESTDPVRMAVHGTLFGVAISGKLDALRKDLRALIDNKFPMDWSVSFRAKLNGRPKADHEAQVNMQRLLLAQQDWAVADGLDAEGIAMIVWDNALGKSEGAAPLIARYLTEEQILAMKPGADRPPFTEQAYTVEEIVTVHEYARVELEKALTTEEKEKVCGALPLVGRFMFRGSKCDSYCSVKKQCDTLLRKYGEPGEAAEAASEVEPEPDAGV